MGGFPMYGELPGSPEEYLKKTIELLENAREEQHNLLKSLLEKHGACEYLQRHGLDGRTDLQSYRERIPLITFADVEKDIQRVYENPESNVLLCDTFARFNISSGTSGGKFKIIPVSVSSGPSALELIHTVVASFNLNPVFKQICVENGMAMAFLFNGVKTLSMSPTGLVVAEASTHVARNPDSNYRRSPELFTCPVEVIMCPEYHQSLYCQLLCGLVRASRVVTISSIMASVLATALTYLKKHWEEMCTDIETGKLNDFITDDDVRRVLTSDILQAPNPELAARIRAECSKDSWAGILMRLWPNLKVISTAATGAMLQYASHLEFFTNGQVPIVTAAYVASEGFMAFNPHLESHPRDTTFVFHPKVGFFEFMSLKDPSVVVELADVKEGEEYEIVVTNLSGFWRYRMGDLFKCIGYYHSSPEFQLVGRHHLLISVAHELTYEHEITESVPSAAKQHLVPAGARLVDYAATVDMRELPGRYIIFWEMEMLEANGSEDQIPAALEQCCMSIENALNDKYRMERIVGGIAPMEILVVEPGSFSKLSQAAKNKNQYKQPRTYKPDHPAVEVLYSCTQTRFRSPALPRFPSRLKDV